MAKMKSKEDAGLALAAMTDYVDMSVMQDLAAQGFVRFQTHPSEDLLIWNYTEKTQFERVWTPETLMCRGLITDSAGRIHARPFKKFFNLQEHMGPLPEGPYEVWAKVDGSLGILYWIKDEPFIATRGSFNSDQAAKANEMLRDKYLEYVLKLDRDFTYLFEIIYPENRIVVDYGDKEALVLLAVINTKKEWEITPNDSIWPEVVPFFSTMTAKENPIDLLFMEEPNAEGFVLKFLGNGLRLKLKFNEYLRLHKVMTGLTHRDVWASLSVGGLDELEKMLGRVPDEFYGRVKEIADGFIRTEREIEERSLEYFRNRPLTTDRREIAEYFKGFEYPHILFMMLDGRDYKEGIYKIFKPGGVPIWMGAE